MCRLVVDFPDDEGMRVSHETIYRSLYVQGKGGLKRELVKQLRSGRKVRKTHKKTDERRGRIKDMTPISARPHSPQDRAVPGSWEGDLIIGARCPVPGAPQLSAPWLSAPPGSRCWLTCQVLTTPHPSARLSLLQWLICQLISLTPCPGPRSRRWPNTLSSASTPTSLSTSLIRTRHGNEARMRTRMGCCGSTSPRAPVSSRTAPTTSKPSPMNSTVDHGKYWAGKPRQKRSPSYYQNQTPQQASLLRPLESALVGPIAGRSFAESVFYADTRQRVRRLAGLPERLAHIESLSTRRTPQVTRAIQRCVRAGPTGRTCRRVKDSVGLEFFSKPKETPN